jgi:hypothetical protein
VDVEVADRGAETGDGGGVMFWEICTVCMYSMYVCVVPTYACTVLAALAVIFF